MAQFFRLQAGTSSSAAISPLRRQERKEATCDSGAMLWGGTGTGLARGPNLACGALLTPEVPTHSGCAYSLRRAVSGCEPPLRQPWVELVILIKSLGPKGLMGECLIKSVSSRRGHGGLRIIFGVGDRWATSAHSVAARGGGGPCSEGAWGRLRTLPHRGCGPPFSSLTAAALTLRVCVGVHAHVCGSLV